MRTRFILVALALVAGGVFSGGPTAQGGESVFNGQLRIFAGGQGDHGVYPGGWGGAEVKAVVIDAADGALKARVAGIAGAAPFLGENHLDPRVVKTGVIIEIDNRRVAVIVHDDNLDVITARNGG